MIGVMAEMMEGPEAFERFKSAMRSALSVPHSVIQELTFTTQDLRRGFIGDQMFDSVVAFLVARGALEWMGKHLVEGKNAALLSAINTAAVDSDLFKLERQTIDDLAEIKITVRMLEGE
jgi:hypothetical protein